MLQLAAKTGQRLKQAGEERGAGEVGEEPTQILLPQAFEEHLI